MNTLRVSLSVWVLPFCASGMDDQAAATIAAQDWVPREELPEAIADTLPGYCHGAYVPFRDDPAAETSLSLPEDPDAIHGSASYLEADPQGRVRLEGGVDFRQGPWRIFAESALLDRGSEVMDLPQGVTLKSQDVAFQGDRARLDLQQRTFELDGASFVLYPSHARGSAESIRSDAGKTLTVTEGIYTTCPPHSRAWRMRAGEMELNQEKGEGYASNLYLEVQDVPVLYFPYLAFPLDDRRRSGFLYPSITNSNAGSGLNVSVPYYFNLAPNYDLTYAPRLIYGRGLLSEVEARHVNLEMSNELRVGYISQDTYYEDNGGRDAHRWAVDWVNLYNPAPGWESEIDVNAVSDNDYLEDLNRTLEINKESHVRRIWDVRYQGDFLFSSRVMAYQTIDDTIAEADRPYLLLPQLNFEWRGFHSGVNLEWNTEYTYFWRDQEGLVGDEQVIGSRMRSRPSLSYPLTRQWGYLVPKLSLDHTDYFLEDADTQGHQGRTVPFGSLDAGLYFDRRTEMFGRRYNQSLEPRVFYVRSARTYQDDIPVFDTSLATFGYNRLYQEDRFVGGDRVGDNNRVTLGFTTRLGDLATGNEVLRASLGQILYFEDREVTLNEGEDSEDDEDTDSPLAGEIVWRPNSRLDAKIEGQWSASESRTDRGATTLSFHDSEYRSLLNLSHRFDSGDVEQTEVSGLYELNHEWTLLGRWVFDLRDHRTIGMLAGVEYNSCCWRVQFIARDALTDDEDTGRRAELERSYFLRFELRGLGNLSNQLEKVLGEEMRNFSEREEYRREKYNW